MGWSGEGGVGRELEGNGIWLVRCHLFFSLKHFQFNQLSNSFVIKQCFLSGMC